LITGVMLSCSMTVHVRSETIALSLPLSGDFSEIGRGFSTGAKLAMELLGADHSLFIADDGCDPDLAKLAAKDIESQKAAIVTGMICNEAALALASGLRESQIPLLIAGARSVRLIKDREREEWNLWRMNPGDDAAAKQIARHIIGNFKDTAFAIIDDGTIYGRSLTDTIRLQLNEAGMKPQFSDTFRAAQSTQSGMLRRLERSGVAIAIIAAATTEDLFTIAKDHKALGIETRMILTEHLSLLPFLEDAEQASENIFVMMEPPHASLNTTGQLGNLLIEREIKPERSIYEGFAAVQLAIQALEMPDKSLAGKTFETIIGTVEFNDKGENIHNPYKLHIWREGALEPVDPSTN